MRLQLTKQSGVLLLREYLMCVCRHRAVYYLQAVMRCEIDKQSWPQEVKVQEKVFVTAPVPPDYLSPLKASSVRRTCSCSRLPMCLKALSSQPYSL